MGEFTWLFFSSPFYDTRGLEQSWPSLPSSCPLLVPCPVASQVLRQFLHLLLRFIPLRWPQTSPANICQVSCWLGELNQLPQEGIRQESGKERRKAARAAMLAYSRGEPLGQLGWSTAHSPPGTFCQLKVILKNGDLGCQKHPAVIVLFGRVPQRLWILLIAWCSMLSSPS